MDGIAIEIGWAFCSTLLMFPPEVCAEPDHARFIGGAVLILTALGISIPLTIKVAEAVSQKRPLHPAGYPSHSYQRLPPMPGPAPKRRRAG